MRALRAFEAVARCAGVTRAAEELAVSHSAVSQQVKLLEEHFGQRLFVRSSRGLAPTPEALAFLGEIRASFDRIAAASERLTRDKRGQTLRIDATPSFAMRWLIPQMAAFQQAHPEIELRISTSMTDGIDHLVDPVDFVIRRDMMQRADHVCRRFLDDMSTVVADPKLIERKAVALPTDVLRVPLLHLKSRPDAWTRWFGATGVPAPETPTGLVYDHFFLSLQAAINGFGAAIGPLVLVEEDLRNGLLVAPFPEHRLIGPGFHVLHRQTVARNRLGREFLDWLMSRGDSAVGER